MQGGVSVGYRSLPRHYYCQHALENLWTQPPGILGERLTGSDVHWLHHEKFINRLDNVVEEMLRGLVLLHPGSALLSGDKVMVRLGGKVVF
jgi:hypothetical protein